MHPTYPEGLKIKGFQHVSLSLKTLKYKEVLSNIVSQNYGKSSFYITRQTVRKKNKKQKNNGPPSPSLYP